MAVPGKELKRPKLSSVDDLFGIQETGNATLPIDDALVPFPHHPFRLYEGERLDDMVESIRKNGVLVPIIVRKVANGRHEILSGHNRVNASVLAGKVDIPAVIKENLSDEEAWIYVVETNLMQRSFSDMSHSEKAAVLSTQYSKLFSQGKRNDIKAELNRLENPHHYNEKPTSPQSGAQTRSDEIVGMEYGLSKNTVSRYLRIAKLTPSMLERLDNGSLGFMLAVAVSFLSESHQCLISKCIDLNNFSLDKKKVDMLREYSDNQKLDEDAIYLILSGEVRKAPKRKRLPIRVGNTIIKKFFSSDASAKEIQNTIDIALTEYFERIKTDAS